MQIAMESLEKAYSLEIGIEDLLKHRLLTDVLSTASSRVRNGGGDSASSSASAPPPLPVVEEKDIRIAGGLISEGSGVAVLAKCIGLEHGISLSVWIPCSACLVMDFSAPLCDCWKFDSSW